MLQFTEQEKKVVLFVSIVLGTGALLDLSGKACPRGKGVLNIIGDEAYYPRLNVNTASKEELLAVPGVGPARAERIVQERRSGGPYRDLADLGRAGLGGRVLAGAGKYFSF